MSEAKRKLRLPSDILQLASSVKLIRDIEAQGWKVGYKEDEDGIIREVFFLRSCMVSSCPIRE